LKSRGKQPQTTCEQNRKTDSIISLRLLKWSNAEIEALAANCQIVRLPKTSKRGKEATKTQFTNWTTL